MKIKRINGRLPCKFYFAYENACKENNLTFDVEGFAEWLTTLKLSDEDIDYLCKYANEKLNGDALEESAMEFCYTKSIINN